MLSETALRFPEHPALIAHGGSLSYRELQDRVERLASGLRSLGLGKGDKVGIFLPNCPEFVLTYFAVVRIGAVAVPCNILLKHEELRYIYQDAGVSAAVTSPALLPVALQAKESLPSLQHLIVTDPATSREAIPLSELIARHGPLTDLCPADPGDTAVILYTSGTTGRPKGAMLSHHNITWDAKACIEVLEVSENDNFLCVLPLFHSFAATVCMVLPFMTGGAVTLMDRFVPNQVLEAISQYGVTLFAGVPTMYAALLHFAGERAGDFSRVRVCVSGGAPMPLEVMRRFEERFNTIIVEGDGPTECAPVVSVNPIQGVRKTGSVGLPLPGVEVKIFDDNDRELPTGEVGEIVVRGENVMQGYYNQPEATAEALRNGWLHTGDLGKLDEDGYLYIVDRKKDMIIVGGLNVYPREIEEVLYTHPKIAEAAVIGVWDKLRGEAVHAVIALKPGEEATEREIIQHCREHLANFKVPRSVEFRESLPKSSTGKILKRMLRKEKELEGRSP